MEEQELDYIPLTTSTSSTQTKGNNARSHSHSSSSYRTGTKRTHPIRTTSPLPQLGGNQHNRPSKKAKRTKFYAQTKERSPPAAASGGSAFVVPDGESVTLRPPRGIVAARNERTRERVNVARLEEEGWTRTDLCSLLTRHPGRFANVNMVVLFDLDNAAGWFNIHRRVLPNVLVLVFSGSGGVYGSLPRQPLLAGLMSDDRLFVTVCGGGKNSADFGLTYTAGELNRLLPKECMFAIVSNDTDFKHLMSHLRKTRPNSYQIKANSAVMANKHLHCILGVLERRLLVDQAIRKQEEQSREVVLILDDDVSETGEATGGDDREADERPQIGCGQRTAPSDEVEEEKVGVIVVEDSTPPSSPSRHRPIAPSLATQQARGLKQQDMAQCRSAQAQGQPQGTHDNDDDLIVFRSAPRAAKQGRPERVTGAVAVIDLT